MRSALRWIVLVAAVAAAVGLSAGAYRYAARAWDGVVSYESPYVNAALPTPQAGPPMADRVVLVIVDGLRADAAAKMSSFSSLRRYGGDFTLTAPQPSLSYPNWTTILSGTTQDYHGVVTNWHEGAAPVENLLDAADRSGAQYVVVGPSDIATLFPAAARADASFFREWSDEYLSGTYVDQTLRLVRRVTPRLVLLHLPDIDEAGHDFGGASDEYAQAVARVDGDLRRLVEGLQDGNTAFVIVADHGHIDTGGHGGWESEVVNVPAVFAGTGVRIAEGRASLEDIAPTVAVLAGIPVPRFATGVPVRSALATPAAQGLKAASQARDTAVGAFAAVVRPPAGEGTAETATGRETPIAQLESARDARLAADRRERSTGPALLLGVAAVFVLLLIAAVSWRALVAALAGTAAYYAVYNALFFVVHGNRWSLSAFNSEDAIDAWMNQRLLEAALAGIAAALVAGLVYPLLRREPKGPRKQYLPGWLALGPVTVLVAQLTLAFQVAWFEWAWGSNPVWGMPDLKWGFKFDLDLIQATALGTAALLAPVVTYLVGRYHPKVRKTTAEGA